MKKNILSLCVAALGGLIIFMFTPSPKSSDFYSILVNAEVLSYAESNGIKTKAASISNQYIQQTAETPDKFDEEKREWTYKEVLFAVRHICTCQGEGTINCSNKNHYHYDLENWTSCPIKD